MTLSGMGALVLQSVDAGPMVELCTTLAGSQVVQCLGGSE